MLRDSLARMRENNIGARDLAALASMPHEFQSATLRELGITGLGPTLRVMAAAARRAAEAAGGAGGGA